MGARNRLVYSLFLTVADVIVLQTRQPRNHSSRRKRNNDVDGIAYPIDIWFLIAEHVKPEDIQRFSAICRATHIVSHTARFWLTLYRRCAIAAMALSEKMTGFIYTKCLSVFLLSLLTDCWQRAKMASSSSCRMNYRPVAWTTCTVFAHASCERCSHSIRRSRDVYSEST